MVYRTPGQSSAGILQVSARTRFGRYKDENQQTVREAEVKNNPVLDNTKKLWNTVPYFDDEGMEEYTASLSGHELFKRLELSLSSIESFSLALAEFQDEKDFSPKAGLFLTTLINNGSDEDYIIHTGHLSVDLDFLGYKNTKNIIVRGNAGNWVGMRMQSGSVTVEGNARHWIGQEMEDGSITVKANARSFLGYAMKGGSIIVEGNTTECAGHEMKGGSILVKGNTNISVGSEMKNGTIVIRGSPGHRIGFGMKGGEVHIEEDDGTIASNIKGGKIYHKGKLIVDK